jgi:hypothetical protein
MALWVFVYLGTTPIGSALTGWISTAAGARVALGVGAVACLLAAAIATRAHTPPRRSPPGAHAGPDAMKVALLALNDSKATLLTLKGSTLLAGAA